MSSKIDEIANLLPENAAQLAENQYVKELFSILNDNGRDTSGLVALIQHVREMEGFVNLAEDEIAKMKTQLDSIQEIQHHPIRGVLKEAVKTCEQRIDIIKTQISILNYSIFEGCLDAARAFREKGISALDKLASFFNVKGGLKELDKSVAESMVWCDMTLATIDSFAKEYHSVARHLKNIGRILTGKKPIDVVKEAGKLASAISAPYKAEKTVLLKIRKVIATAIGKLDQLENTVETQRVIRTHEKKPSLLGELQKNLQRVEREKLAMPVPERVKIKDAEL